MRWHEMAIDQAELEHKVNMFREHASKVEELCEELLTLEKKSKGSNLWPMPWFLTRLKRKSKKTSLERILKVLAFNEDIYNSIAMTRMKLNRNTEIVSESDRKAETDLRQSLVNCEVILSEIEGRFAKFDGVFKSMGEEPGCNESGETRDKPKSFLRFFRKCF